MTKTDEPLPSLNLSSLKLSPKEVACAFHLPLSAVLSPLRLHHYLLRGARPYYAIDVTDFVSPKGPEHMGVVYSNDKINCDNNVEDEPGNNREGRIEVWGLTGWYLTTLLRILGVYAQ